MNIIFGNEEYYKTYAKLTLAYIYDKKLLNLKVEGIESPDMQNEDLSLGIEVTRAITQEIGVGISINVNGFGKNLSYNDIKKIAEKKKKFKGEIFKLNNGTTGLSFLPGMYDTSYPIKLIEDSILTKLKKLNKEYKIFKTNGLYIYAQLRPFDEYNLKNLLENINNTVEYKYYFSIYFINCTDKLIIYDCSQKKFEEFNISNEIRKKIDKEVLG